MLQSFTIKKFIVLFQVFFQESKAGICRVEIFYFRQGTLYFQYLNADMKRNETAQFSDFEILLNIDGNDNDNNNDNDNDNDNEYDNVLFYFFSNH